MFVTFNASRDSPGVLVSQYGKRKFWDATAQTYSKWGNAAQIYELKRWIHGTTQGEWSVTTYFHHLRAL
jgi:hypothetical protein